MSTPRKAPTAAAVPRTESQVRWTGMDTTLQPASASTPWTSATVASVAQTARQSRRASASGLR
ncbi:MAG: hypothetical protein U0667_15975 [Chloroflexota bacterium]